MDFLSDRDRLEDGEFEGVVAWQRASDLSVAVYLATDGWPRIDPLDLMMEMRASALLAPTVIAFGFGTGERDMLLNCLGSALDALRQLDAQLGIAVRVGYCSPELASTLGVEIAATGQEIENLRRAYSQAL